MKKIILFACILFHFTVSAQTVMTCEEKVNKLLIEKIKPYASNDLIPYYSEQAGKWGFFHRKTKKIVTKPIFNEAYFFRPTLSFSYSFEQAGGDGCNGEVLGSQEHYTIKEIASSEYRIVEAMGSTDSKVSYKNFVKSDISGFEIDMLGNLASFNPRFYDEINDRPNILHTFNIKNEYYAITTYKENDTTYYAVINQKGIALPNFEKLQHYPILKQSYSNEKDAWFWIETGKDEYIFRSLLHGTRLKETFTDSPNWTNHAQNIGYAILTIGKQNGLMDLTTMEWKIKPSIKNDFSFLEYASLEPLHHKEHSYDASIPTEMIQENREKAYIYIQNSKNQYLDLDLKLYKPIH
ncbi:hypothetical protein LZQ00_10760 [Sphingobacterium sp. SRCM116780]|uniref:hypothetical protein n=1 Tax=Sphingobacterium sp. SRCM116780 TaxID=2907623 RepID=UPI001F211C9F|nr:hypothetical protein [Sphingobacterium sp. SRCM116780]UIR54756.1 hypothetical protein LZQ00_10760 [Sphingobacterium sp. SRCM116780]